MSATQLRHMVFPPAFCGDCHHHTCGGTINLRDAGSLLGWCADNVQVHEVRTSKNSQDQTPRLSQGLSYLCGLHCKVKGKQTRAELHRPLGHELSLVDHTFRVVGILKVRDRKKDGLRFLYATGRHACPVIKNWGPRGWEHRVTGL